MPRAAERQATVDLPTVVLTIGGSGSTYHRPEWVDDVVRPACSTDGKNYYLKEREVVETHYNPCRRCFPRA